MENVENVKLAGYKYKSPKLAKICLLEGIDYHKAFNRMSYLSRQEEYKNLSEEELIEIILHKYKKKNAKYFYKGMSIKEYCLKNNLSFPSVAGRIHTIKRSNPDLDDDKLVELALTTPKRDSYSYKGSSLRQYCIVNELNYGMVMLRVKKIKKENNNISMEKSIDIAIKDVIKKKEKYIYKGKLLKDYCKEKEYDLTNVKNKITYLKSLEKYKGLSNDKIIEMGIERYLSCQNEKYIDLLLEKVNLNEKEMKILSKYFCLNLDEVRLLQDKYKDNVSVLLAYYFSNESNENYGIGEYVENLVKNFKDNQNNVSIYDLIRLYKSKLIDTREVLLKREEKYFSTVAWEGARKMKFHLDTDNKGIFIDKIKKSYLMALDNIKSNNEKMIKAYIYKSLVCSYKSMLIKCIDEKVNKR